MARQMSVKGFIKPTERRLKAINISQRKVQMNIDYFWSVSDSSEYEDYDSLSELR